MVSFTVVILNAALAVLGDKGQCVCVCVCVCVGGGGGGGGGGLKKPTGVGGWDPHPCGWSHPPVHIPIF